MTFNLTVLSNDPASEKRWVKELQSVTRDLIDLKIAPASESKGHGQILFVDAKLRDLDHALDQIERGGRAVFLIAEESSEVPEVLIEGRVDDVLVFPFRKLEVMSKLRHYQQILMWEEVAHLNSSFSELLDRVREDLKFAEKLQKAKLPTRFPEVKGFHVAHRYLAGMKPGGDHFDLAESKDQSLLSVILSDSSSYGLSSSVLSILMKVAMKLSQDEARSSYEMVRRIQEELMMTLGIKDQLSLFYGIVSRKDYRLKYLNLGTSCAFYAQQGKPFRQLPSQGIAMNQKMGLIVGNEAELHLEPESRLVLVSDGFIEAVDGVDGALNLLNQYRDKEAVDAVNEMVFQVKSKLTGPDDMPPQDCTAVVLDVSSRVIRLMPKQGETSS